MTTQLELLTPTVAARREAKVKADETAALNRERILAAYRQYGRMTADEAGAKVGLAPHEARPRVTQLNKAGKLRECGRGKSAFGNPAAILEAVG